MASCMVPAGGSESSKSLKVEQLSHGPGCRPLYCNLNVTDTSPIGIGKVHKKHWDICRLLRSGRIVFTYASIGRQRDLFLSPGVQDLSPLTPDSEGTIASSAGHYAVSGLVTCSSILSTRTLVCQSAASTWDDGGRLLGRGGQTIHGFCPQLVCM